MLISAITLAGDNRHSLPGSLRFCFGGGKVREASGPHKRTHTNKRKNKTLEWKETLAFHFFFFFSSFTLHTFPLCLSHTHTRRLSGESRSYDNNGNSGDVSWLEFHRAHVQNASNKHSFRSSVRVWHACKESIPKLTKAKTVFLQKVNDLAWIVSP